MTLDVQIHTGSYTAGAVRVDTNLSRKWGYGRKQRKREGLLELIFVEDERVDEQLPTRCISIMLQLPVFLALNEALYGAVLAPATIERAAVATSAAHSSTIR